MRIQLGTRPIGLPLAAAAVAITGLSLASGAGPAAASVAAGTARTAAAAGQTAAAASTQWRIVRRTDNYLNTIVTPSAASAWVLGDKAGAGNTSLPAGDRWNGHTWSAAIFPASVTSGIACSAASSAGNVWAFAGSALYGNGASYAGALQLSHGAWVVRKSFSPAGLVSGCTVLSPASAWVYGLTHVAPGPGGWPAAAGRPRQRAAST